MAKLHHFSFSSLKKLRENPREFYKGYIRWEREPFWSDNMVVGSCVHKYIELYNTDNITKKESDIKDFVKNYLIDEWVNYLNKLEWESETKFKKNKLIKQVMKAIDNFLELDLDKPKDNEYKFLVDIEWNPIKLKGYIDAVYDDSLLDYKIVRWFSDPDSWFGWWNLKKYWYQGLYYCLSYNIAEDADINVCKFLEIKKTKPRTTDTHRLITFEYTPEDFEKARSQFKKSCKLVEKLDEEDILENFDDTKVSWLGKVSFSNIKD